MRLRPLETQLVPTVPGFSLRAIYSCNSLFNKDKPGTVGTLGMFQQISNLRMEPSGNETGNAFGLPLQIETIGRTL